MLAWFDRLISIPVTNTSVNPARSTGPAAYVGGWALKQLWMFWVAPIAGAVAGALLHRYLVDDALSTGRNAPDVGGVSRPRSTRLGAVRQRC